MLYRGKYRRSLDNGGLGQRFGIFSPEVKRRFAGRRCLWLHAVSVGEVAAVEPLVKVVRERYPRLRLVVSTVTETGNGLAQKLYGKMGEVIYFPLDFDFAIRRAVEAINPAALVIAETEIWPNTLRYLHQKGIPAIIINGRISNRSFRNYLLVRKFIGHVLNYVSKFCMQTDIDAEKIQSLGADPDRVMVAGNLKFDRQPKVNCKEIIQRLQAELCLRPERPVWVAGSTHSGEEEMVLAAYKGCLRRYPELMLILAPRHPERLPRVEALLEETKLPWVRRSHLSPSASASAKPRAKIILLDTVGELSELYGLATVVFVGGSLVPTGGHNVLEPALWKAPILFGPYMDNFQQIADRIKGAGGAWEVQNSKELEEKARQLLADPKLRTEMGEAAYGLLEKNRGATQRTLKLLENHLPQIGL